MTSRTCAGRAAVAGTEGACVWADAESAASNARTGIIARRARAVTPAAGQRGTGVRKRDTVGAYIAQILRPVPFHMQWEGAP